jgi:hypothetical protein
LSTPIKNDIIIRAKIKKFMTESLQLIISLGTIIGMMFLVYNNLRSPGENSGQRLDKLETACVLKHRMIDESLVLIKEKDLQPMKNDLMEIKHSIIRINTILEERE